MVYWSAEQSLEAGDKVQEEVPGMPLWEAEEAEERARVEKFRKPY
jgi:hypothetical protein